MNIFLVLSPLQLINALEAKGFFGTKDNTLIVLRHTSQGYPLSMFKHLLNEADWDHVYYLSTFDSETVTLVNKVHWHYLTFRMKLQLEKIAHSLGSVKGLFIGQYAEPIVRHFVNVLSYNTLYLVDDGTATLEVNDERAKLETGRGPLTRTAMRSILLGLQRKQPKALTFFTVYDLTPLPGDKIILNRYTHFRNDVVETSVSNEVWFLGGPLVLDGYLSEEMCLCYLKEVRDFYRDRYFVYIPHSREPKATVELIRKLLDCEIRQFGLPVEFVLRDADPRPVELASFITSALTNCHILFGQTLQLTSFYLEPKDLLAHHGIVHHIYKQFQQEADPNFKVVDLPP